MKDTHLEFNCGCRFEYDYSLPLVNGKPSIIFDPENVNENCEATWDLICEGRCLGVFQLESGLGQHYAKKLKPRKMEHLSALSALLRPGTLNAKDEEGVSMTDLYCQRKNGIQEVKYEVQSLKSILDSTYGIMTYQEQIIQIARDLAGFTESEADSLRKSMGKKDTQLMAKVKTQFIEKASSFGIINNEEAVNIFDNIEKSQRYLFNHSHAWAYALMGYRTAFMKQHFPIQFFTAYLYYAKDKIDPIVETRNLINDAKSFGIEVKSPRFSLTPKRFKNNGVEIVFGLSNVTGIGEKIVDKIRENAVLAEQVLGKPRSSWSWYDFLFYFSGNCNCKAITNMISVGGLQDMKLDRRKMIFEYDMWLELSKGERKKIIEFTKGSKVESLKSVVDIILRLEKGVTKRRLEKVKSIQSLLQDPPSSLIDSPAFISKTEEENLGISLTCNKVDATEKTSYNITTCQQFKSGFGDRDVVLAVEITDFKEFRVKTGDNIGKKMGKLTVADSSGAMEAVCFSKAYATSGNLLYSGNTVQLIGQRNDDGGFRVESAIQL